MRTTPPLRWGLIGASDIAATRIVPAILRGSDTVEFVYSSTLAWAEQYAAIHGISNATADLARACEWPGVDAVYISSTNEKHAYQTLGSVAAGKHVLCEKPLALTVADGQDMLRAAEKQGVVLAVNHHLPGAATHRAIQHLVSSGNLGRPLAMRIGHAVMIPERLKGWRLTDLAGGGVILDITVHDISAAQAILGNTATEASAIAVRQGAWSLPDGGPSDAVMATLRFGDAMVQLHDAFTVAHCRSSIEVIGTEGSVRGVDVMTQDPFGTLWRTVDGRTEQIAVSNRRDLYDIALDGFRSATAGLGQPTVTAAEGLSALAGALAVARAASTRRNVRIASVS
ncbi:Gfo/Idh/MocA family protein [Candidatus Poriferisodalis sp.]|uniref:Gfo/Idh/MocA family protein n=1 Tax=Candidatus Poriferisodalis sp. TaxID=3101277 RepID=UPI003B02B5B3